MLLSLLSKRTLYDDSRDSYGFTVRPQHVHRYREYSNIYKEEEGERSDKWKEFLEQQAGSRRARQSEEDNVEPILSDHDQRASEERDDSAEQRASLSEVTPVGKVNEEEESSSEKRPEGSIPSKEAPSSQHAKSREVKTWADIRPSLNRIDHMMGLRVKKRGNMKSGSIRIQSSNLPSIDETGSEDENERIDPAVETSSRDILSPETSFPWNDELVFLVQGGVPKDLRGEVWQAFVGVRTRRVERYYQDLLAVECDASDGRDNDKSPSQGKNGILPEKLKKQIEKDLPRTFPGHPALNENGRNSLRRVLSAYALHNPSVGYCQTTNFFAGLLLLMMPEENAFWTLVGLIDDYFEGYFSQEMTESQVCIAMIIILESAMLETGFINEDQRRARRKEERWIRSFQFNRACAWWSRTCAWWNRTWT